MRVLIMGIPILRIVKITTVSLEMFRVFIVLMNWLNDWYTHCQWWRIKIARFRILCYGAQLDAAATSRSDAIKQT